MKRRPLVSVVVATRNQGRFLRRCLRSLTSQSLPREVYEIIVIDDGSTDSTRDVLCDYRDRVEAIHLKRHRGLAAACSAGLTRARGQFIVRVDSDDWLDLDALSLELDAFNSRTAVDIFLPDYWEVSAGRSIRRRPNLRNVFSWVAAGPMMRLQAVTRAGGYRPFFWEEYDLYLRLLKAGARPGRLPVPLVFYRRHSSSMTADRKARMDGWRELLKVWPPEVLSMYGSHRELSAITGEEDGSSHDQDRRHRGDR